MGAYAAEVGPAATDGTRVYVRGSSNAVNTYRLTDGGPLWRAPLTVNGHGMPNTVDGLAVAGGVVYTGGAEGVVAYDAATGRRLWTGPGSGAPVVAGSRVLSAVEDGVVAVAAAGCGRLTCPAVWRTRLPDVWRTPLLGGADGVTAFVTWVRAPLPQPGIAPREYGMLARLSVATGAVQWSASAGTSSSVPVRAGGTVWVRNATREYRGPSVVEVYRLMAWPAAGTGTAPLRTIPLGADRSGVHGGLAVAGGSVVVTTWPQYLDGFRVPGT
jgi:outer membrane protein assembly factor BamB